MNQFHELNILTSRGDLRSSFLLIKSYSEGAARKIMKKAGYYVPDVKGSSFWRFVQDTIATAAKNLTCGYRKGMQTPHAERTVHQVEVCTTEISLSAEVPASTNEKKTQSCARSEMHSTGAGNVSSENVNTPKKRPAPPENGSESGLNRFDFFMKVTIFWLMVCLVCYALPAILSCGDTLLYISTFYFPPAIWALSFFAHHYDARRNRRNKIYLTFHSGQGVFNAAMPLCVYIPKNPFKLSSLMAKNTCKQMKNNDTPVVMRSHLLCNVSVRDRFIRRMKIDNIRCEMTSGPEKPRGWRHFMLYWVTPVIIGSFQFSFPSLGSTEYEMKLSRTRLPVLIERGQIAVGGVLAQVHLKHGARRRPRGGRRGLDDQRHAAAYHVSRLIGEQVRAADAHC